MPNENPSLEFEIRASGGPQAAGEITQVGDAAKQSAGGVGELTKEATATGTSLRQTASGGREFMMIMGGISQASEGGAGAIGGVIMAVRGLMLALRTAVTGNPIGLLVIAVGTLVGAFLALKKHGDDGAKSIEKTKDAAAAADKELDRLAKGGLDEVAHGLEVVDRNAQNAVNRLQMLLAASNKLSASRLELDVAKVKADPTLSAAEKDRREFDLRQKSEADAFQRSQDARAGEIAARNKEVMEAGHLAQEKSKELRLLDEEIQARKADAEDFKDQIAREKEKIAFAITADPRMMSEAEKAQAVRDRIAAEEKLGRIQEKQADNQRELAETEARRKGTLDGLNEASKKASELGEKRAPEIEKLKTEQKVEAEDFSVRRTTSQMNFGVQQQEHLKTLGEEDKKLAAEYSGLKTADEKSLDLGGIGQGRERMAEIERRRAVIAKESDVRTVSVAPVQAENTTALKEVNAGLRDLTATLKAANAAPPVARANSGGTIEIEGRTIKIPGGRDAKFDPVQSALNNFFDALDRKDTTMITTLQQGTRKAEEVDKKLREQELARRNAGPGG